MIELATLISVVCGYVALVCSGLSTVSYYHSRRYWLKQNDLLLRQLDHAQKQRDDALAALKPSPEYDYSTGYRQSAKAACRACVEGNRERERLAAELADTKHVLQGAQAVVVAQANTVRATLARATVRATLARAEIAEAKLDPDRDRFDVRHISQREPYLVDEVLKAVTGRGGRPR